MSSFRSYCVCLVVFLVAMEVLAVGYRPAAAAYLRRGTNEGDYLESLRENSKFGCLTLLQREPDIVVVGDSHAYSAFDFSVLSDGLSRRVGACVMGGLDFEGASSALALAAASGARDVVLGLSPRMFWRVPATPGQQRQHELVFEQARFNTLSFWRRVFVAELRGRSPFPRSAEVQLRRLKAEEGRLAALEDGAMTQAAGRLASTSIGKWRRRIGEAQLAEPKAAAERLCDAAKQHRLRILVLPLPESPVLESLYPAGINEHYRDVLSALQRCGIRVLHEAVSEAPRANQDYANRELDPDYPYAAWYAPEEQAAPVDLMDLDHMNGVGARRFTEWAVPRIQQRFGEPL
jgi:hypothetical protein